MNESISVAGCPRALYDAFAAAVARPRTVLEDDTSVHTVSRNGDASLILFVKKNMRNWPIMGISSWRFTGLASMYRVSLAGTIKHPGWRAPLRIFSGMLSAFSEYSAPTPEMKRMFFAKFSARALGSPVAKAVAWP